MGPPGSQMMYMLTKRGVYALSLSGGAVRWHYPMSPEECRIGGVAVGADGTVYAACVGVVALNGVTGAAVWPTVMPAGRLTGITIGPNDVLFVGDSVGNLHAIV